MPQFGYREDVPGDIASFQRLGSTFSDALLGLAAQQQARERYAQQMGLESAYLQIAREKARRESMLSEGTMAESKAAIALSGARQKEAESQGESYQARALLDRGKLGELQRMSAVGGTLGRNLNALYGTDPARYPLTYNALRSSIAGNEGEIVATHPANLATQVGQIEAGMDPRVQALMATKTPMERVVPGSSSIYNAMDRSFLQSPAKPMNQYLRVGNDLLDLSSGAPVSVFHSDKGGSVLSADDQKFVRSGSSAGPETYANEQAARKAGKKAGDKVYLQGVGLVQLH
jgi:hypothetical protein